MRNYRIAIGTIAAMSCFITLLLYYWHRSSHSNVQKIIFESNDDKNPQRKPQPDMFQRKGTPFHHIPLNELYHDKSKETDESISEIGLIDDFKQAMFIDTPGCRIPVTILNFHEKKRKPANCAKRAVFLKKEGIDEVKATIKEKIIRTYLRKTVIFECCYRFIMRSTKKGEEIRKIRYTPCKKFLNGASILLESDFINIKCFEQKNNISREVYDDVYAFTKMINITRKSSRPCRRKYNVLLLGMDSMSFSRIVQIMPRTVKFFKENFWLGYQAFHKIGDNTLPNLMAALTGLNMSSIADKCAGNMEKCKELLIWNKFEEEGYVTAYGEDYLRLPDTFHGDYEFKKPPTHHYLRPLYIKGETELFNKSLVCAGKIPSAQHLLDYAFDFAVTYRLQQFFGMFWMNSYSHNENSRPQDADNMIENFFNRLTYTGIMENTFIIFFSDHGVRFGKYRMQFQSYYDERLPFMFIWTPNLFKGRYTSQFKSMVMNQYNLVTPYDLYNTLIDIHPASICDKELKNTEITSVAEGCPKCHGLFNTIDANRTCQDVEINNKWCSCHTMYPLDVERIHLYPGASKSVVLIVSYLTSMSKTVEAKRCWTCVPLQLRNVIRIHFYYDDTKVNLYHVVAVTMSPGNVSYEAVVMRRGENAQLLGSVSVISPYRGLGRCTVKPKDRVFCVCQKIEHCN